MIEVRLPSRVPLRFIVALCLGVVHALAFLDDSAWPIQILAQAALFAAALRSGSALSAARLGFGFGLGWFMTGISWVYVSMHNYGKLAAPLAAAATLLFSAYLALFPALALWVAGRCARAASTPLYFLLALIPAWTLGEMARGVLLTGFPWLASGYAHVDSPLAGFVPLAGVYGACFVSALLSAVLAALGQSAIVGWSRRLTALLIAAGLVAAGAALRTLDWSQASGAPLHVRLMQGNVAQDMKFDPHHLKATIDSYLQMVEAQSADLIVLPETALPLFLSDAPPELIARLHQDADRLKAAIAVGVPIADSQTVYTNSIIVFLPGDDLGLMRYDKAHLVPFGEFVPLGFHWFVRALNIPLGDFTAGSAEQRALPIAGQRIAFNICYEDLFGEDLRGAARNATILVNASNVAWFGDSMALPQHLDISRVRAIEMARPMLRATNTGMTAVIDAHGRVQAVLKPLTAGVLDASVTPMKGDTPYLIWGNAPIALVSLAMLAIIALAARRPARAS